MTRLILAALAAFIAIAVISGTGCNATGIGDPCVPEQEYRTDFIGFDYHEVSVESKSFQCMTRLCLVNHFQGRVSCPYGQAADGTQIPKGTNGLGGAPGQGGVPGCKTASGALGGCCTPGVSQAVTGPLTNGMPVDTTNKETVPAQCSTRTADEAVYCSCRCANINGQTNDGANYCTCPDGFACTQLITSIGQGNEGLTGAYCIKSGTQYDPTEACAPCTTEAANCGTAQGVVAH
jgi:hypothetical protein